MLGCGAVVIRPWLQQATQALLGLASVKSSGHVLDVAIGAGDQTLDIAERAPKATYWHRSLAGDSKIRRAQAAAAGYCHVETRISLANERLTTWANVLTDRARAFEKRPSTAFDHVIIDEAQDLAPAELRFFAAFAPAKADGLFLSGDIGQRIIQHPYSWASLGVDARGRSHTLKVCYRTSQQIRRAADRLLPSVLRDRDGIEN